MQGLGERIKLLRKKQGLTIVEIVKKTGIDQGTLSRIENGKMRGTLDSHVKIAEALGIPLPDLYQDVLSKMQEPQERTAKEKLETFAHSSGAVAELLTNAALQKKMMPVLLKIKPGGHTEKEEYPPLTERFLFVLEGNVQVHLANDSALLKEETSLYFNASRPHHFTNAGKKEARILSVITPVSL